jgi:hypothetical protein
MGALVAALGCSVMMVLALGAFAWYASRAHNSRGGSTSEAGALQAELAALRRGRRDGSGDDSSGRT